jgi:hypothetical protein
MTYLARGIILLLALVMGCGDDVIVIFSTNFGVISGNPDCRAGQFDLRNEQGLILIVVLNSDSTIILSNSSPGTCSDLNAGATVRVSGQQSGSRIAATEVRVQ